MTLTLLEYEGGTREKHGTDASDDHTEFQAYDETAITDRIRQAVQDTRGQILTYDGKFLYTEFHSVSGGMTAAIAEAFPKLAEKAYYLVPVPTNGIDYAPEKYRDWTVRINRWEVAQAMGLAGELYQLTVSQTGPSGRALELSANDGESLMHAAEFRQAVGFDRLFSTNFSAVRLEDDAVVFQGSGWGHGAGMEQWGAYAMAETGSSATQIVNHYYPDAQLIQLYP
jgi:stage II sporulation protein D